MRMRGKKPIFGIKDTWSLDETLSPIICEGLKKYKEVSENENLNVFQGFPDGFETFEDWVQAIDQMIYAFGDNEPNIFDYQFSFLREKNPKDGPLSFEVDNPDEHHRYCEAEGLWYKRRQEGRELFAKYFHCLWW